jgi:RNA polymerase sigma-70 factor (ECF subfamily)
MDQSRMDASPATAALAERAELFPSTHWSTVLLAGEGESERSRLALNRLSEKYWRPLFIYILRKGHGHAEAQDLTQGFFEVLLEKEQIGLARRERGKFRAFLLTALNHFLINQWKRERAEKRGGGRVALFSEVSYADDLPLDPADGKTAERIYEEQWALTILENAYARLREEWRQSGRNEVFGQLLPLLANEPDAPSCRAVAVRAGISENAVKVSVHRMRRRLRELLREEIAQTVESHEEIDGEVRHFIEILGSARRL